MSIIVKQTSTDKELKEFVWLGINMQKNNPYAAPPLFFDDYTNMHPKKNPSLALMEVAYFLAYKNNTLVGRIAGIINPIANQHFNTQNARFGFFECINDVEVAKALFNAAETWAKNKGMQNIQGPLGFTDFDQEGLLVYGFNELATLVGKYNEPYLPQLVEACGYRKDIDWLEYEIQLPNMLPERFVRMSNIVKEKHKLNLVNCGSNKDLVKRYGHKVFELLNICYKDLYNFSQLSEAQVQFYIKMYFSFFKRELIAIVTDEQDTVVGVGVTMPSLTKALQKAKGKLFPFGWWHLLQALRKNDRVDLYLIAIHPDYQSKGVNAVIFNYLFEAFTKNGYKYAETNAELETNHKVISLWGDFERRLHKKRRSFIKNLQ